MSWLNPNHTERPINGKHLKFFMVRPGVLTDSKPILIRLAKSLAAMTYNPDGEQGQNSHSKKKGVSPSGVVSEQDNEITIIPASEELASSQREYRSSAWETLAAAAADDSTLYMIGALIVSSLREQFTEVGKKGRPREEDVEGLLADIDTETLIEMLKGVWEANKKLYKGFSKALPPEAKATLAVVANKLTEGLESQPPTEGTEPSNDTSSSPAPS